MYDAAHISGLDFETDNRHGFGLDPRKAAITQAAFVTGRDEFVFEGDERGILTDLNDTIWGEEPGLVSTWNGAFFDLPFFADRARILGLKSVSDNLRLLPQPDLRPKYDYLPDHFTGYTALFPARGGLHSHLDISFAWRAFAESHGTRINDQGMTVPVVPWSLKPVLRAAGFHPVEIDRTRLHDYSAAEVNAYVVSDASGTRDLTLRTLGLT